MTQRIDLDTVREPAPEFIRKLGTIREPIELVSEGTVVARLTAPSALTDEERQRILDEGWAVVEKARAATKGVPTAVIQKEVDKAVREVRGRHGHRRR